MKKKGSLHRILGIGQTLSEMIMPNIGAFIAWGFFTAIFICPGGWFPNESLSKIQIFMLNFLIPILIAGQGGKIIGGQRGRVVASIAIMGCIASDYSNYQQELCTIAAQQALVDTGQLASVTQHATYTPMLMPAMIVGPLSGFIIKKFDELIDGKVPHHLELLVSNFSIGIIGMLLAIIGYIGIGPFVTPIFTFLYFCVDWLIKNSLLPFVAIFLEPAKVLFLNNAINLGIFAPIGQEEVEATGKSIMFLLETNPGPGLGVLLAIWFFSKNKLAWESAPGAIVIHLFGGIHEIYFPYILSAPLLILAPIVGNMLAIFWFLLADTGCVGVPAPGSVFTVLMMAESSDFWEVATGIFIATIGSFLISWPIILWRNKKIFEIKAPRVVAKKTTFSQDIANTNMVQVIDKDPALVTNIVFACTVGIGFSVMGAAIFAKRLKEKRPDITINNFSVNNIPSNADIVVCESNLKDKAKNSASDQCQIVEIENFLEDPALDDLFVNLTSVSVKEAKNKKINSNIHLLKEGIKLNQEADNSYQVIQQTGELLRDLGFCTDEYIESMHQHEKESSTYLGMGVVIAHGVDKNKDNVLRSGIVLIQYPDGIDFNGETAYLSFGVAGIGTDYIELLAKISDKLQHKEIVEQLIDTNSVNFVLDLFDV